MKLIKIIFLNLILVFIANSCNKNENFSISDTVKSFKLNEPAIGNVFLNFSMPENPALSITWNDDITGTTSYSIEFSTDYGFSSPVVLGTSTAKFYTISVDDLNEVLNANGVTSYSNYPIYIRVKTANDKISNVIAFNVNAYPIKKPVITNPTNATNIILSADQAEQVATQVEWTDESFDENATVPVSYFVEIGKPGQNFSPVKLLGTTEDNILDVTHLILNQKALSLGLAIGVAAQVQLRVRALVQSTSGVIERISEITTFTITPYSSFLDLSTPWGIVGSATPNQWNGPDLPFYQTDQDGIFVAYVTLGDGEIKFRKNNDWAENYGDNGNDGTLEAGGANMPVTAGNYQIYFDINNMTWSISSYSWGIVGSATPNQWNGPDIELKYDPFSNTFKAACTLNAGEIKFRKNNDWGVNYGDNGADGSLEPGGSNIVVTYGHYIVTLDMSNPSNPTYSVEPTNLWGVVGDAAPNGWDGPNVKFTPNFGDNQGLFYIYNITLTNGEIKFRQNDDWGVNYGDNGNDGTLETGGSNIPVSAGVYNIILDLSNPDYPTYTLTLQ